MQVENIPSLYQELLSLDREKDCHSLELQALHDCTLTNVLDIDFSTLLISELRALNFFMYF